MSVPFSFELIATDGKARRGVVKTSRGDIRTPAFMPVGNAGTVKAMYMDQVRELGADVILGNTYHLMLRPGAERVAKLGGLHKFGGWSGPILTDSGGFQVMSLASLRKMTEEGVTFQSHVDGAKHFLSPERSIEIQGLLGSDIQMQLDECIALPAPEKEIERAMELSLRWAERSAVAFGNQPEKAMFGIVQGGDNERLRLKSAHELSEMHLKGYSIGGLAVGETKAQMAQVLEWLHPILPENKPRYLMGVGTPEDLINGVLRGVDIFHCVLPTRLARHGSAFYKGGRHNLKNAKFKRDDRPITPDSAVKEFSRAYINHLIRSNEILGHILLSMHNIGFLISLMHDMRQAIRENRLRAFADEYLSRYPSF